MSALGKKLRCAEKETVFMAIVVLLFFFLSFFILKRFFNGRRKQDKIQLPPGPKKLPILGNMHQIGKPLHKSLRNLSNQYGPLMHLKFGVHPTIVVSSAEMAKQFLEVHDLDCCSRPSATFSNKISYGGSDIGFSPYNEKWRELRKIAMLELFSTKMVSSFQPVMELEIKDFIKTISASAEASTPINLSEGLTLLANNMICKIALGKSYQKGKKNDPDLHEIFSNKQKETNGFFVGDFFPLMRWIDVLTGRKGRLDKYCKELDYFFEEVIKDRLNQATGEHGSAHNILDRLLHLKKNGSSNFTWNNIKGIIMDIFLAGTETSSSVITWTICELMKNPRIMKKAQNEVRQIASTNGKVDGKDVHHMQYLKLILKENLRLNTPSPILLPREVINGFRVDGYDVEPKTRVIINAWAICRDEKYWDRPEEFCPERFMNSSVDIKGHDFQLLPFGAGRRICPGMNIGMTFVELVLANLLYAFNWDFLPGMTREDLDMEAIGGITMKKKNPLILMATGYNSSEA